MTPTGSKTFSGPGVLLVALFALPLVAFLACSMPTPTENKAPLQTAAVAEKTVTQTSSAPFTLVIKVDKTTFSIGTAVQFNVELRNTSDSPQAIFLKGLSADPRVLWKGVRPVMKSGSQYYFACPAPPPTYPSLAPPDDSTSQTEYVILEPGQSRAKDYVASAEMGEYVFECRYENDKSSAKEPAWIGQLHCESVPVKVTCDMEGFSSYLKSSRTGQEAYERWTYLGPLVHWGITPVIPELLAVLDSDASAPLKEHAAYGLQEFAGKDLVLLEPADGGLLADDQVRLAVDWARKYVEAHPEVRTPSDALLAKLVSDFEKDVRPAYEMLARGEIPLMEGLEKDEFLDICEATFRRMFEDSVNWRTKLERRFISVLCPVPYELLARFKGDAIPVKSPFVRDPSYTTGKFVYSRYYPEGDNSLFYQVSTIRRESDSKVVVECDITQDPLIKRWYEYSLEKRDGKWIVISTRLEGRS